MGTLIAYNMRLLQYTATYKKSQEIFKLFFNIINKFKNYYKK